LVAEPYHGGGGDGNKDKDSKAEAEQNESRIFGTSEASAIKVAVGEADKCSEYSEGSGRHSGIGSEESAEGQEGDTREGGTAGRGGCECDETDESS
jgi:hypothetical protein